MIDEQKLGGPVDLAREADFMLGSLRVRPSICQTQFGAQAERLEPRVMQVLVALVQANGAVVSRDTLIARCWRGRIVGEDAINRTLGKLRVLARDSGGAFEIETISRVGYRLQTGPAARGSGSQEAVTPPATLQARVPRRPAFLVGAVIGALTLATVLTVLAWRARPPGEWTAGDYELLVAGGGGSPDLSPDGRFLVYHKRGGDGSTDIWMRGVREGEPVRLVDGPDDYLSPTWSPRGDQVAFVRVAPEPSMASPPCRIYVKAVPDGLERLVGRCQRQAWTGRLAWSPSGDALVFSESVEDTGMLARIRRLDLQTGALTDLTTPPLATNGDRGAIFSPDGRTLAFVRYRAHEAADVFILDLQTDNLTQVTRDQVQADVEWSPDGRALFVASRRRGPSELWSFDLTGRREPKRLLVGLQEVLRPSAVPGLIAFTTTSVVQEIVRLSDGVETPVASGSSYRSVDVSPGGVVAFISQDPVARLWLQPPGQPARRLRDLEVVAPRYLAFSPDGGRLSLIGDRGDDSDIHIVDVASGAMTVLASPGMNVSRATWTPDGTAMIRSGTDGRIGGIARLDGMSEARRTWLTGIGWPISQAAPEGVFGERLRAPGVWRIGPTGQTTLVAPKKLNQLWRVTRGAVYVLDDTDNERAVLLRHSLSGGPPTQVATGPIADFAVDPRNGDVILVRNLQMRQDIGLLGISRQ